MARDLVFALALPGPLGVAVDVLPGPAIEWHCHGPYNHLQPHNVHESPSILPHGDESLIEVLPLS